MNLRDCESHSIIKKKDEIKEEQLSILILFLPYKTILKRVQNRRAVLVNFKGLCIYNVIKHKGFITKIKNKNK